MAKRAGDIAEADGASLLGGRGKCNIGNRFSHTEKFQPKKKKNGEKACDLRKNKTGSLFVCGGGWESFADSKKLHISGYQNEWKTFCS